MVARHMYLIGMTGNIACGKSTVLQMLQAYGAFVIDADQSTHMLQQPGEPVYAQIVAAFGSAILVAPDGPIDRRKLGAIVFNDPQELRRLETIVHPAVHEHIMRWLASLPMSGAQARTGADDSPTPLVAVIDAIKLLEAGWKPICNAIWVVTCTPEQQVERLMRTRGMTREEADMRVAAQPPQAEKVTQADVVIDNSGTLDQTRGQVEAAWHAMLRATMPGSLG